VQLEINVHHACTPNRTQKVLLLAALKKKKIVVSYPAAWPLLAIKVKIKQNPKEETRKLTERT
jgi:hypothetical protein